MHINPYRLHAKGFHPQEIDKATEIIQRAHQAKSNKMILLEKSTYWLLLAVAILGNILVSLFLIPFIILFSNVNLYIILILLGAAFGIMISAVIKDMEMAFHHHTLILFIVPLLAFIFLFIITTMANTTAKAFHLTTYHDPVIVGLLYIGAFLLPYINFIAHTFLRKEKSII